MGWLDSGSPVAVQLERDPMRASAALDNWRRAYPQHPANDSVLVAMRKRRSPSPPNCLIKSPCCCHCPGRAESTGAAVRDGFIASYLEQDPAKRPRLKIYDVAAEPIAAVYNRAIADGAGFIVGPLTKERRGRHRALERRQNAGVGA